MEKQIVYVLELEGQKAIYLDIHGLCDSIKNEFLEGTDEDIKRFNFIVSAKEMTGDEIDDLPEFDGF